MGNKNNYRTQKNSSSNDERALRIEYKPELKDDYKIIFLGECRVGTKTSLINRLQGKEFNSDTEITLVNSFAEIEIDKVKNRKITFKLWDTIGLNKYKLLTKLFLRDSDCAVIGYDINNKKNFEEAKNYWYPLVREFQECKLIYLIGNKIDLNDRREVPIEEAIEFAEKENIRYFEISCKKGIGIKEFFDDLVNNLIPQENL